MIELKDVSVVFPDNRDKSHYFRAVNDVTLKIESGEIYGIVGYSGAGKSTLLRVINQLQRQDKGQVLIEGKDISNLSNKELLEARKNIGMIFQHFNLLKQLNVAENIAFPLKNTGLNKKQIEERVDELLELVDLSDRKYYYPVQLSGGQQQRVSIARALASEPKILLSDEATSALDPKTTKSILTLLKKINKEMGITIVLITHEMSVIKEICDKVAVMQDGKIIERGTVFDIFTNPQKELTKKYIRSASPTEQGIENILNNPELLQLKPEDKLIRIDFAGDSSEEPLIAKLAMDYKVLPSILFGNVEIIQEQAVGTLLVSLSGDAKDLKNALNFVKNEDVSFTEYSLAESEVKA